MTPSKILRLAFLIAAFILTVLLLGSCGVIKKTNKTDHKENTEIKTVETSTVTESYNGIDIVKGDTLEQMREIDSVKDAVSENENIKIITHYNPKTHSIKTTAIQKPHSVPVNYSKVTVTNKKVDEKKDIRNKDKVVDVKRESVVKGFNLNWLWLLLLIPIWRFRRELFGH